MDTYTDYTCEWRLLLYYCAEPHLQRRIAPFFEDGLQHVHAVSRPLYIAPRPHPSVKNG